MKVPNGPSQDGPRAPFVEKYFVLPKALGKVAMEDGHDQVASTRHDC